MRCGIGILNRLKTARQCRCKRLPGALAIPLGCSQENNRDPTVVAFEILILVQLRHSVNQCERSQFKLRPLFSDNKFLYQPTLFQLIEQCKRGLPKSSALPG